MKKNILLGWAVALAALLTGACTQQPLPSTETQPGTGTMIVRPLVQGDLSTRSGEAYTGELASEKAISNIQVLTFDKTTGHLEFYHTYTVTTEVQEFALRAGTYRIWAVANGPDLTGISTETALKQLIIDLGTYNDPASDFIMAGSELSTVIAGDTAECLIYLTRLVSRVSLKSITNRLPAAYGPITVDYVMLTNVVGSYSIGGPAGSLWHNPCGRKNASPLVAANIIAPPSVTADAAGLTFRTAGYTLASGAGNTTAQRMYAYPNASTLTTEGFSSPFTTRCTRLVVRAQIDGSTYYYPVNLPALVRNACYDVSLTLIGLGSTDPDIPVHKGMQRVDVEVTPWEDGGEQIETI